VKGSPAAGGIKRWRTSRADTARCLGVILSKVDRREMVFLTAPQVETLAATLEERWPKFGWARSCASPRTPVAGPAKSRD
jgi:hypothetical protein